jgi:hypothetical protein
MSLIYKIDKTKLEPDSIRRVGDWELYEDDHGHIFVFEIAGIMSSAGIVNECRNDDTIHVWTTMIPYSRWEDTEGTTGPGDGEEIAESILEDIKKTMPNPTQEQLDTLKKLEFYIVYINGKWKRTHDFSELIEYHPERKTVDWLWSMGR